MTSCSRLPGDSQLFFGPSSAGKATVSGSLAITRVAAALNSGQAQREVPADPAPQQPAETSPTGGVCATFGPKVRPLTLLTTLRVALAAEPDSPQPPDQQPGVAQGAANLGGKFAVLSMLYSIAGAKGRVSPAVLDRAGG